MRVPATLWISHRHEIWDRSVRTGPAHHNGARSPTDCSCVVRRNRTSREKRRLCRLWASGNLLLASLTRQSFCTGHLCTRSYGFATIDSGRLRSITTGSSRTQSRSETTLRFMLLRHATVRCSSFPTEACGCILPMAPVSYTHLRAHETPEH